MKHQNSSLGISSNFNVQWDKKRSLGTCFESWSELIFKNLTEFSCGNWNFKVKTSNLQGHVSFILDATKP